MTHAPSIDGTDRALSSSCIRIGYLPTRLRVDGRRMVVIVGGEPGLFRLRGTLVGWQEHMPEENGLAWLAGRIDELAHGRAD